MEKKGNVIKKHLTRIVLSIIFLSVGWGKCDEAEVELWGECYSIENTTYLDLSYSGIIGEIPESLCNLENLDLGQDSEINILDVDLLVSFIFGFEEPTEEQSILSDSNEDCEIMVIDIIGIVNLILGVL